MRLATKIPTVDLNNWHPYNPPQIRDLMRGLNIPYWIAGGYALELFAGYSYRSHGDLDIVIERSTQTIFRNYLSDHLGFAADPPGTLRCWSPTEFLTQPINDVWVKKESDGPFVFQLMFVETEDGWWFYKRDHRISGLLSKFGLKSDDDYPIIAPHIQLLYKAKNVRAKDQLDFEMCLPLLNQTQALWLKTALGTAHPNHQWLNRINECLP